MQEEIKDPQDQKDQGRASFGTGSTTQGGSNYGQGSSQLGGEAIQQGASSNSGANYANEQDRLGSSSTGTNNEGASSPNAGAGKTGSSQAVTETGKQPVDWSNDEERNDKRRTEQEGSDAVPNEGDRRDTSLEDASGMGSQPLDADEIRRNAGAWSQSSTKDDK